MVRVFTHCLGLILAMGLFQGCIAKDHIVSRPTIEKNPDWQMVESCGYERCTPMVDFLSAKDIRIRIEAFNHRQEKIFAIKVGFVGKNFYFLKSDEYEFEPSAVTVKLSNGIVLKPKGFTCSYTRWDKQYLQSAAPIEGAMTMKQNNCFLLFFDYPPPSVEEEFTMDLNGLKKLGQHVSIPTVHFRKAISRW